MKSAFVVVLLALIGAASASQIECGLCKLAANGLDDLLTKKDITSDVVNFMEKSVCHLLPSADQSMCEAVMETAIPSAVELIEQKFLNNDAICDDIHACDNNKLFGSNNLECSICEAAISWVEKEAQDPSVQQFIESELDKVCALLPQNYQDTCEGVVSGFGPTVLSWIAGKLDAVCDIFHCNSAAVKKAEDGLMCDLCEKAVGGVTDLLNNYNVSGYVESFLEDNLCNKLGSYEALCDAAVESETPSIIAAIEAKILDPETLCTEIHMCSSSDLLGGSVECSICDAAASYIGQQLQNPDVQNFVDSELEKICSVLPSQYSDTCNNVIQEFGPMLLSWVSGKVSDVCTDVLHCSSAAVAVAEEDGLLCEACELLAGYGIKYLESLNLTGYVESFLEQNLCTKLGSDEAVCDAAVESGLPLIINKIESYLFDASELCKLADLCTSNANGFLCSACQTATAAISKAIVNPTVEQYVETELEQICSLLPSADQATCKGVVDGFGPTLLDWVSGKLGDLCTFAKLC